MTAGGQAAASPAAAADGAEGAGAVRRLEDDARVVGQAPHLNRYILYYIILYCHIILYYPLLYYIILYRDHGRVEVK